MQFLVYVTVLMVSISTVLLEVHWLTTPPPQPKLAAQAVPPRPKTDGPNVELSPVYPKKSEAVRPAKATGTPQPPQTQQSVAPATNAGVAVETSAQAAQSQKPSGQSAKLEPPQKQPAETTGSAPREATVQPQAVGSNNSCDVQACATAYKSFRAADCTYQPFDGSRRVCEKPPVQRTARDQREEPERRKWNRDGDSREVGYKARWRADDDADDRDVDDNDVDDDRPIVIHRQGPRW